MPTDEHLVQQAQDFKQKGNEAFGKGVLSQAISHYSQGVVTCDRLVSPCPDATHATLLSNRAMCYLKTLQFRNAIDDCSKAIDDLQPSDPKLRVKLWFRRAKARFVWSSSMTGEAEQKERKELLQEAAKDLLLLLQTEPSNKEAQQLLGTIRAVHKTSDSDSGTGSPLRKTLQQLRESKGNDNELEKQAKILLGLVDNDTAGISMELGRMEGVISELLQLSVAHCLNKSGVFCIMALSRCASHPSFCQQYLHLHQIEWKEAIEIVAKQGSSSDTISDWMVAALGAIVRMILHTDRDPNKENVLTDTRLDYDAILNSCVSALNECCVGGIKTNDASPSEVNTVVLRAVLDVWTTFTCGRERDHAIRSALPDHFHDPTLFLPVSPADIRQMTPKELAAHRKWEADTKKRDQGWAFDRSVLIFGGKDPKKAASSTFSPIRTLMRSACACDDHVVRREVIVVISRMLAALDGDDVHASGEQAKALVTNFLADTSKDIESCTIEEVYNEDDEEGKIPEDEVVTLETKMERALLTAAVLLMSKKDVGAWALGTGWRESTTELPDLVESENPRAMCLASEVLSGAAALESSRHLVAKLVSSGTMELLMISEDRDIRSGAASAVAKLGLSDKNAEEIEKIGLLQAACDLLEASEDPDSPNKKAEKALQDKLNTFHSYAGSSVERAIEMMTYLVVNTEVKEELAAGFSAPGSSTSGMERLVAVCDLPNAGESLSGFGLATIFHHLAVTNLQLRKESFEGREVTMEQYDEMQKMGKTEEEKEIMDAEMDFDTQELCDQRIRKMASANVPRALVTLIDGASEHTLEQLVLTMSRMAGEASTRGVLIQQGILSACIKIEKNEGPTETDTMKKVIRLSRHSIAKMLITTNPSLLTSAQRLGSIRPLIQLVRDIKASDLMHFEALLALTNLASSGDDAQNRMVTEAGIPSLHYAMFSDHELVRRAATECMCNLVSHAKMLEHLYEPNHLKLWLAFANDYEEHYECARAATGCLAMATQDPKLGQLFTELEKFKDSTSSLLECGRLEIMYRAMAIVLNLVNHGGDIKRKSLDAGLVAFCQAYVESYHDNTQAHDLDFSEEEKALLPVTVNTAMRVVQAADS